MPFVRVTTNRAPETTSARDQLLATLSKALASAFDKPERWVMTCLDPVAAMTFGGTADPTAYVEVKNIGVMGPEKARAVSAQVTHALARGLGIAPDRIYVELSDASAELFGWNGDTFA